MTEAAERRTKDGDDKGKLQPEYYMLELRKVPLRSWTATSPFDDWLSLCEVAGQGGFPPGTLSRLPRCSFWVQLERCVNFPLGILTTRVLPFTTPLLFVLRVFSPVPSFRHLTAVVVLQLLLGRLYMNWWRQLLRWIWVPRDQVKDSRSLSGNLGDSNTLMKYHLDSNGSFERPNHIYFGTKWVIPRSIVEGRDTLPPSIVCLTPHGMNAFGASAAMHRFLKHMVRFGVAPAFFKVPFANSWVRRVGAFPAGKRGILKALAGGDSAGLLLDGIPGMFYGGKSNGDEELFLQARKPVCAIALQAGCPIIPGYCFGTNDACTVIDPLFGALRWVSSRLDISLTPWLGRWWLPFGPPARCPMAMCIGDPIPCPKLPWDEMSNESRKAAVDAKHTELLEGFRKVFDTHKAAYGRPNAKLSFV